MAVVIYRLARTHEMALWPPPKLHGLTFATSPAEILQDGDKKIPRGVAALKFLFAITEDTEQRADAPEYPFKFTSGWLNQNTPVMTANVLAARRLAAITPIAQCWAKAARYPYASKEMMIATRTALKLHQLTHYPIDSDLVPFAGSNAFATLATGVLKLCLCRHTADSEADRQAIVDTACDVWKSLSEATVPVGWLAFKTAVINECKAYIARAYTSQVAKTEGTPQGMLNLPVQDHVGHHHAVYDALACARDKDTCALLEAKWMIYRRLGVPERTPIATLLTGQAVPTGHGQGFQVPPWHATVDVLDEL